MCVFFFFFQAEDGIRDLTVTGVQTCALPIFKFSKIKLDANGLLPWQIGVYSEKLTEAFRAGKWDEAKLDAAILAHYVAQAHDPFSTTDNSDGHLSGQTGINDRFGGNLIDRYSSFFPIRPKDA